MERAHGHRLTLTGIEHHFGATRALEAISLDVAPGEFVALLGPSGCGKTTLLQIIGGFIVPDAGAVQLDGRHVEAVPANRRGVGMVFQSYALFPHLSVFENVAYGLKARGERRERVAAKVAEMLALVQMQHFADRRPAELSGGQQQRVALARALAVEPAVILLDEPFSALDKNLRLDMQIEIKRLLNGYGVTSIMVTHDQEEALSMADRVVVMNHGRIEQIDTPEALYDRPASLFVNQFIGHANLIGGTISSTGDIRLSAGYDLVLSPRQSAAAQPGSRVLVSLRPENLKLVPTATPGALQARLTAVLPLGGTEVIEAELASGETVKIHRSRTAQSDRPRPGAAVGLAITDLSSIGVFPAPPT
ncbi:MAG: ABC transporter ATP-binding protein [Ancalomicrobiaceae bacterium]|nr:ABC transporter ATP-binding protein [Ancalomicrobiaceae bacterium]